MALRAALTAATLIPALALTGCGDEAAPSRAESGQADGAAETPRGGDAVTVGGETARGPYHRAGGGSPGG